MYIPTSYRLEIKTGGEDYKRPGKGLAIKLTQVLVRQGATDAQIAKWHFNPKNNGFAWVRRQNDPEAASAELIAMVDHSRKPMLSTKQRMTKLKSYLATGEITSQKKAIKAVDNPNDWYTKQDIRALAKMGVIQVISEQHGKVTWYLICLADDPEAIDEAYAEYAQQLKNKISRRNVIFSLVRCKRQWSKPPTDEQIAERQERDADLMKLLEV